MVTPVSILQRVDRELAYFRSTTGFGEKDTDRIVERANWIFEKVFVETGLLSGAEKTYVKEDVQRSQGPFSNLVTSVSSLTNKFVVGISAEFYALTLRISALLVWLAVFAPFLLLGLVGDAYCVRRRKEYLWEYVNPVSYGVGLHVLVLIVFGPILYLVVPIALPPFIVPVILLLAAAALYLVIGNMQRLTP
jgi:hypothetical protein